MRVVVAEDSVLVRRGIVALLTDAGVEVVGEAGDAAELYDRVRLTSPDIAVVDIRMPPAHSDEGIRAAELIRRERPDIGILFLSQHVEISLALRIFGGQLDRTGYLLKERVADVAQLTQALTRIGNGETVVEPTLIEHLLRTALTQDLLSQLSTREQGVLAMMAEGRSDQAIADELFISRRTVESHVRTIFKKLQLDMAPQDNRRVRAVIWFLRG